MVQSVTVFLDLYGMDLSAVIVEIVKTGFIVIFLIEKYGRRLKANLFV